MRRNREQGKKWAQKDKSKKAAAAGRRLGAKKHSAAVAPAPPALSEAAVPVLDKKCASFVRNREKLCEHQPDAISRWASAYISKPLPPLVSIVALTRTPPPPPPVAGPPHGAPPPPLRP